MAQSLRSNRKFGGLGKKLGLNENPDSEDLVEHIVHRARDPTARFYVSDFELVAYSKWISEIIEELTSSIIADGFCFKTEDGAFIRPSQDYLSIFTRYYTSFSIQAIRFISITGYLAWFICELPNGLKVPRVCDPTRIVTRFKTDDKTLNCEIKVEWRDEENIKIPLYVINEGLHVGYSSSYRCSPVARCKDQIAMSIEMDHTRLVILKRVAEPQIMLTNIQAAGETNEYRLGIPDGIGEDIRSAANIIERDDITRERVEDAISNSVNAQTLGSVIMPVPPPMQLHAQLTKSIESNYRYVPSGMKPVDIHRNMHELTEYVQTRQMLRDEIREAFGLQKSAKMNPAGGNDGVQGRAPISPIMLQWMKSVQFVMTSVFRVMHQGDHVRVGDIKPTYKLEKEKLVGDQQVDVVDEADGTKRFEVGVKRKSEALEEESVIKTEEGDSARKVDRVDTISVWPVALVLSSRDMAEDYMKQGGISEEYFFSMYPQVTNPEEKKREEQMNKLKEKETQLKEKEKEMKQKEKEDKLMETIKDMQEKIKILEKKTRD